MVLIFCWQYPLKCLYGTVCGWFWIFVLFALSWAKLLYILSAENFIFINFFAVKVDESDVNPGICLYKNLFPDSWVTSLPSTLTAKGLWGWNFRPTRYITIFFRRIQRFHICKIPTDVIGALSRILWYINGTNFLLPISSKLLTIFFY